jgi:hypothetical protein
LCWLFWRGESERKATGVKRWRGGEAVGSD